MTSILLNIECGENSDELASSINNICENQTSIDKFFLLRMKRASDVAVYCHPFKSVWSSGDSYDEWDPEKQSFFSAAIDLDGIPVYFEPCVEMDMNIHSIRALVDHVIKMGAVEPAVVLDQGSSSAENMRYLIDSGIGFLATGSKKTPSIKQMLGQVVKKRGDPRALRRYNDRNYIVFDSEIAVCRRKIPKRPDFPEDNNETDELEIISMADPRFSSIPFDDHMVAWACTENEGNTDRNREQMLLKLNGIESKLMEMDPYEAVDNLKVIAGEYSKYFDLEVIEGELEVKIRQKGVTAALNREGIFIMITYSLKNWNTAMAYHKCLTDLEKMSDRLMPSLSAGVIGETMPSVKARMIVQFCALVLWRNMEKRIHESGERISVRTALQSLNMIMSIGDGNKWQTTEVSPYSKHVLDILHISLPRGNIITSGNRRPERENDSDQIRI